MKHSHQSFATMAVIPSSKPFPAILIAFFLLLLIPNEVSSSSSAAKPLTFSFPNFGAEDAKHLILQGDAQLSSSGTLQLTNHSSPNWNIGRALYGTPFRLWDANTGQVTTFHTRFSFTVKNISGSNPADGIAFFIVPSENSEIPPSSGGGRLGIYGVGLDYDQVVAVEFDSYINKGVDPDYPHIGINVNSIRSLQTTEWQRESDVIYTTRIRYDSVAKVLSALLTHPDGRFSLVSQFIDLKAVLPETVYFGISATTTAQRELHDVVSWFFYSKKTSQSNSAAKKQNRNIAFARYA